MPNATSSFINVLTLDSETTGLATHDEPIALGLVLHTIDTTSGRATGEATLYEGLRKPSVPIHPMAKKVHGIQEHALEGLDFDHDTVRNIINAAHVIISHNAAFDARMLVKLYPEIKNKPWRCSWRQWPWTSKTVGRKLLHAADLCGVPSLAHHQALNDAQTLWQCLQTSTGKTERSRVYLHKLLAMPPFQINYYMAHDSKRVTSNHWTTPPKRPNKGYHLGKLIGRNAKELVIALVVLVVLTWAGRYMANAGAL